MFELHLMHITLDQSFMYFKCIQSYPKRKKKEKRNKEKIYP